PSQARQRNLLELAHGGTPGARAPRTPVDRPGRLAAPANQVGLALVGQTEEGNDRTAAARRGGRGGAHAVRVASPGAPCPALVTGRGAEYAMAAMDDFQGRVAVITGGGGGIGAAMARAFAARGARL